MARVCVPRGPSFLVTFRFQLLVVFVGRLGLVGLGFGIRVSVKFYGPFLHIFNG